MNAGGLIQQGTQCLPARTDALKHAADKRQLWWALSGILRNTKGKHWLTTPLLDPGPLGPRIDSYLEKPRGKSGETRNYPFPSGTPCKRLPEPKFSGIFLERPYVKTMSGHKSIEAWGCWKNAIEHCGREDCITYFWLAKGEVSERRKDLLSAAHNGISKVCAHTCAWTCKCTRAFSSISLQVCPNNKDWPHPQIP